MFEGNLNDGCYCPIVVQIDKTTPILASAGVSSLAATILLSFSAYALAHIATGSFVRRIAMDQLIHAPALSVGQGPSPERNDPTGFIDSKLRSVGGHSCGVRCGEMASKLLA